MRAGQQGQMGGLKEKAEVGKVNKTDFRLVNILLPNGG